MKTLSPKRLSLALVHYPVKNKKGDIIASAITNLDLHDIARAARTYGIGAFYVVTPLFDQQQLAVKIVDHWKEGVGGELNPDRKSALGMIRVTDSVYEASADVQERTGAPVRIVATSAMTHERNIGFEDFKNYLCDTEASYLLTLGTAWGLTDSFVDNADYVLEPISGNSEYNHLSVRSAASIILDRLFGA